VQNFKAYLPTHLQGESLGIETTFTRRCFLNQNKDIFRSYNASFFSSTNVSKQLFRLKIAPPIKWINFR